MLKRRFAAGLAVFALVTFPLAAYAGGGPGAPCTDVTDCNPASQLCVIVQCEFDPIDNRDECTVLNDDLSCLDGDSCNGAETCDPLSPVANADGCVAGVAPCDDGVPCTEDSCLEVSGTPVCTNTPDDGICSDLVFCNGAETCDALLGCQSGPGNPCFPDACDEDKVICFECTADADCDDGLFCNGVETCCIDCGLPVAGGFNVCKAGSDPCDDLIDCTVDTCDEGADACTNSPDNSLCPNADNDLCTSELCDNTLGGCVTGDPIDCDDMIACTQDLCDPATGACTHDPDPAYACGDGLACNGDEVCDPTAPGANTTTGCAPGTPVACVAPLFCTEQNPGACVECETTLTAAVDCDDGFSCTDDRCTNGFCQHTPQDSICADNIVCNGVATCDPTAPGHDPTTGCVPGTPPECDPGFFCEEFCHGCVFCVIDADCDDGDACNGREICADALSIGCASMCTTAPTEDPCPPDPKAECVRMRCVNEGNNQFHCEGTPDNSLCDNGLACDGKEVCDPACVTAGCQALVVAGPGGGINLTGCVSGPAPVCADTFNCTVDACKECNAEICAFDGCSREDCAQGFGCTHTPNDGACEDDVDCTKDTCDPPNAAADVNGCVFTPDDTFCDDGLFCNGKETCSADCNVAGGCEGCLDGEPPNCNDGVQCTTESCNEVDHCVNRPRDAFCSDGIACNGADTCVGGSCPTPVLCCLPGKGCITSPDISECENATTAGESLLPLCYADGCLSAICCNPMAGGCTEDPVAPAACLAADGIPICNACESVVCCRLADGIDCEAGVSPADCIDDERSPACGDCLVRCCFDFGATAGINGNHLLCIDNVPLDLCTVLHGHADCDGCEHAGPPDCDDNIDCTIDLCEECSTLDCATEVCSIAQCAAGFRCTHTADDSLCNDGVFCNGAERCRPDPSVAGFGLPSGCEPGPEPVCPPNTVCHPCVDGCAACVSDADCIDGNPCTIDRCFEVTDNAFICANKLDINCTPPSLPTTSFTQKGSLLVFSKIEIKWDNDGTLLQDTFLSFYNDNDSSSVEVQGYFINGDVPLEEVCVGSPCSQMIQEAEPGWNTADCRFTLTKTNPIYWSAARGGTNLALGGGNCGPFTALDDSVPPGRPDPENGMRTRILRGYLILWAVALNECVLDEPNGQYQEIRWNDLSGDALLVNYERGYAWDYKPWAFQAHGVEHGEFTGTPGVLNLDGIEYDAVFARLLLDFQSSGSEGYLQVNRDGRPGLVVRGDTDLTLHPASADVRQDNDGPVVTKAEFSIYNEFEAKFSGTRRCIQCWDQRLLSHYTNAGVPNHFNRSALGTDAGVARIEGLASTECNFLEPFFSIRSQAAALLGVSAKVLSFGAPPSTQEEWAGANLFGVGSARAVIRYDLAEGSGELLRVTPTKEGLRTSWDGASEQRPTVTGGTK